MTIFVRPSWAQIKSILPPIIDGRVCRRLEEIDFFKKLYFNILWMILGHGVPFEFEMRKKVGHFLLLDHSTPPAVMQPTVSSGTARRTLTTDDLNGIKAIYGARIFPAGPPIYWLLLE
jgi:hypothetical protein